MIKDKQIMKLLKEAKSNDINVIKRHLCGKLISYGAYRDVYELKADPENYVVKIERDPSTGTFANATEWRNWVNNETFTWLSDWLAPCILINQTGQLLIQRRINHDGKRKDYPKYVPAMFTDLKLKNFGWLDGKFVCCDYSYFVIADKKMKYAKWWGSLKEKK